MCHKRQFSFTSVFLMVWAALTVAPVFAVSAGAPSISGSNIAVSGTVSNSDTRGVQGGGSGASAGGSYKLFSAKASKSKTTDTLTAETTAGAVSVDGGSRISGSQLNVSGVVSGSANTGGTVQAGVFRAGPQ